MFDTKGFKELQKCFYDLKDKVTIILIFIYINNIFIIYYINGLFKY